MEAVSSQDDKVSSAKKKWDFKKCLGAWNKSNSKTKKNILGFVFVSREEGKEEINEELDQSKQNHFWHHLITFKGLLL